MGIAGANAVNSTREVDIGNGEREKGIEMAFPVISTGWKGFPHRLAARIVVGTVRNFLRHPIFGRERGEG